MSQTHLMETIGECAFSSKREFRKKEAIEFRNRRSIKDGGEGKPLDDNVSNLEYNTPLGAGA